MPDTSDTMPARQDPTTRWGRLPAWWLLHPAIDADGFCVLAALSTYADAEGRCRPSQATLARHLGRSRPWVNRVIGQLTREGFIEKTLRARENGGTTSCLYRLAMEPSGLRPDQVTSPTLPCPRDDAPRHADDGIQSHFNHHAPAPRISASSPSCDASVIEADVPPPADWTPSAQTVAQARHAFPDVPLDGHALMFVARCRAKGYRYRPGALDDAWLSWFLEDARREATGPRRAHDSGSHKPGVRGRGTAPSERADARLAAWAAVAAAPRVAATGPWG